MMFVKLWIIWQLLVLSSYAKSSSAKKKDLTASLRDTIELASSENPGSVGGIRLTESQKEAVLQLHNAFRSMVKPTASNMLKMSWDKDLEKIATDFANKCIVAHNPDRHKLAKNYDWVGENIAWGTGTCGDKDCGDVYEGVKRWFSESKSYNYLTGQCSGKCTLYTQMVWWESNKLGCGAKKCGDRTILVCNYAPGGNYVGQRPYKTGKACSECPADLGCEDNLCADKKADESKKDVTKIDDTEIKDKSEEENKETNKEENKEEPKEETKEDSAGGEIRIPVVVPDDLHPTGPIPTHLMLKLSSRPTIMVPSGIDIKATRRPTLTENCCHAEPPLSTCCHKHPHASCCHETNKVCCEHQTSTECCPPHVDCCRPPLPPGWIELPIRLTQIDSGITESVWGMNGKHSIYILNRNNVMSPVDGTMHHVSAGQAGVWAVGLLGNVFFRRGVSNENDMEKGLYWEKIPGNLKQIDSGPYNIVWGVNRYNRIFCRIGIQSESTFRRDGIPSARPEGTGWMRVEGSMKYVSCGELGCWAVNKRDNIYFRAGITAVLPQGTHWTVVPGKLRMIESGPGGVTIGLSDTSDLFVREGVTIAKPDGIRWVKMDLKLAHVTVGTRGIMGILPDGTVAVHQDLPSFVNTDQPTIAPTDASGLATQNLPLDATLVTPTVTSMLSTSVVPTKIVNLADSLAALSQLSGPANALHDREKLHITPDMASRILKLIEQKGNQFEDDHKAAAEAASKNISIASANAQIEQLAEAVRLKPQPLADETKATSQREKDNSTNAMDGGEKPEEKPQGEIPSLATSTLTEPPMVSNDSKPPESPESGTPPSMSGSSDSQSSSSPPGSPSLLSQPSQDNSPPPQGAPPPPMEAKGQPDGPPPPPVIQGAQPTQRPPTKHSPTPASGLANAPSHLQGTPPSPELIAPGGQKDLPMISRQGSVPFHQRPGGLPPPRSTLPPTRGAAIVVDKGPRTTPRAVLLRSTLFTKTAVRSRTHKPTTPGLNVNVNLKNNAYPFPPPKFLPKAGREDPRVPTNRPSTTIQGGRLPQAVGGTRPPSLITQTHANWKHTVRPDGVIPPTPSAPGMPSLPNTPPPPGGPPNTGNQPPPPNQPPPQGSPPSQLTRPNAPPDQSANQPPPPPSQDKPNQGGPPNSNPSNQLNLNLENQPPSPGSQSPSPGGQSSSPGGQPPSSGGQPPSSGGQPPPPDSQPPSSNGQPPQGGPPTDSQPLQGGPPTDGQPPQSDSSQNPEAPGIAAPPAANIAKVNSFENSQKDKIKLMKVIGKNKVEQEKEVKAKPQPTHAPHTETTAVSPVTVSWELTRSCCAIPDSVCPIPKDCIGYIECHGYRGNYKSCERGKMFNPITNICDYPRNVDCESVKAGMAKNYEAKPTATAAPATVASSHQTSQPAAADKSSATNSASHLPEPLSHEAGSQRDATDKKAKGHDPAQPRLKPTHTDDDGVLREVWFGLGLSPLLTLLTNNPRFPTNPDEYIVLDKFEAPPNAGDGYGQRLSTYYKAPQTGEYVFYMSCDNECELWISPDTEEIHSNLILELKHGHYTSFRQWHKYPDEQTSRPIYLQQGEYYFMESFMKEGAGGDDLSIGVKLPNAEFDLPISKSLYLVPGDSNTITAIGRKPGQPVQANIAFKTTQSQFPQIPQETRKVEPVAAAPESNAAAALPPSFQMAPEMMGPQAGQTAEQWIAMNNQRPNVQTYAGKIRNSLVASFRNNPGNIPGAELFYNHPAADEQEAFEQKQLLRTSVKRNKIAHHTNTTAIK